MVERGNLGWESVSVASLSLVKAAVPLLSRLTKSLLGIPFPSYVHLVKRLLPGPPIYQPGSCVASLSAAAVVHRGGRGRAGQGGPRVPEGAPQPWFPSEVRGLLEARSCCPPNPAPCALGTSRWPRGLCRRRALLRLSATSPAAGVEDGEGRCQGREGTAGTPDADKGAEHRRVLREGADASGAATCCRQYLQQQILEQ